MRYRHVISRRTLLRGAGTIAIGLPLLEEMFPRSVYAQTPPVPRAMTVFFGLGCPPSYHAQGFLGPLEPLQKYAPRLQIFRGLDLGNGQGFHWEGAAAVFTGERKFGNAATLGPSIDYVIRTHHHERGRVPDGRLDTLNTGHFFRIGEPNPARVRLRIHRSFDNTGNVTDPPKGSPVDAFRHVFGEGPVQAAEDRARRSILDTVIEDYRSLCSSRVGLSAASRARVCDHLERVRALESRIMITDQASLTCPHAALPTERDITGGQRRDTGSDVAVRLHVDDWSEVWRQHADVFAMAFKCDVARFGSIMLMSAGERINLEGDYRYQGRLIHRFDAALEPHGSHEHFHNWRRTTTDQEMVGHYVHLTMRELVYLFDQLDDPHALDVNGRTIFDNAFLLVGTELGDGSDLHDTTGVLHALAPANGAFRVGGFNDHRANAVDLYNTCLRGLGIERTMGNPAWAREEIPDVIA